MKSIKQRLSRLSSSFRAAWLSLPHRGGLGRGCGVCCLLLLGLVSCTYTEEADTGYYLLSLTRGYTYGDDILDFSFDGIAVSTDLNVYRSREENPTGVLKIWARNQPELNRSIEVDLSKQKSMTFVMLPGTGPITVEESYGGETPPTEENHIKMRFFYTDNMVKDIDHMRLIILGSDKKTQVMNVLMEKNVLSTFHELDTTSQQKFFYQVYNADVTPEKKLSFMPLRLNIKSKSNMQTWQAGKGSVTHLY